MLKTLGKKRLRQFRNILGSLRDIKNTIYESVEQPEDRDRLIDDIIHILKALKIESNQMTKK